MSLGRRRLRERCWADALKMGMLPADAIGQILPEQGRGILNLNFSERSDLDHFPRGLHIPGPKLSP